MSSRRLARSQLPPFALARWSATSRIAMVSMAWLSSSLLMKSRMVPSVWASRLSRSSLRPEAAGLVAHSATLTWRRSR
eukprot:9111626-Lingulodinium_polyedra.AAC.1